MRIHFIAIGGAAMHNIAIALYLEGNEITGSDDEIFEPSKSRLAKYGLLPKRLGWNPNIITPGLDAIILGMHARKNNPELIKAQELGLKIYSFPEFLYEQTKTKKRVVIGGSHGKTTITSMIMHVLKHFNMKFDYMVGSQLEGFETMTGLYDDSDLAVFEGDEYLSSPTDPRPKFHLYYPHIAVISGIAWDHINVFPTFEDYCKQFEMFTQKIEKNGILIYYLEDENIRDIISRVRPDIRPISYTTHDYVVENEKTYLLHNTKKYEIHVFGRHNMQNIKAAQLVCRELGVDDNSFYRFICSYSGAKKRLQLIGENEHTRVFLDFAHSPSKLKATVEAVKNQYPDKKLIACMELHTFSSLTKEFLKEYKGSMLLAEKRIIYFNPTTIEHKKLEMINPTYIKESFADEKLEIFTNKTKFEDYILSIDLHDANLLLMSSGNFAGIDFQQIISNLNNPG